MSDATAERCTAITPKGTRCTQARNLQGGLCIWHDPHRADEIRTMRQKGQRGSVEKRSARRREKMAMLSETAGPMPPVGDSIPELTAWLQWALFAAGKGEIARGDLIAMTGTARTLLSAYNVRDLEKQLKAASKELEALRRKVSR
ncbi:MAG: hypothetical protein SFU57_00190 [Gemmatimonadales bacterium]|nr:hypothetical protein [Gemmatimonadales bacterium]